MDTSIIDTMERKIIETKQKKFMFKLTALILSSSLITPFFLKLQSNIHFFTNTEPISRLIPFKPSLVNRYSLYLLFSLYLLTLLLLLFLFFKKQLRIDTSKGIKILFFNVLVIWIVVLTIWWILNGF